MSLLKKLHTDISQGRTRLLDVREGEGGQSTVRVQPGTYLLLAIWFGLLTGLGEVFLLGVKKFFLHRFINVGPDIVWMAPLADVVFFAVPGFILFLVAWLWPRFVSLRVAVFVQAFLSFVSLLLMYYPLHLYARLLLAAGLAVQVARLVARPPHRFYTLFRRATGRIERLARRRKQNDAPATGHTSRAVLLPSRRQFLIGAGATVAGLAVGVQDWQRFAEHRALTTLPRASRNAPNILLIVLDTVRTQSLSLYGYRRHTTPQLERLAKAGVCFERAISTAPWTLPTLASMFTGRWHHEVSAGWRTPLDDTYPTLAEVLSVHGYVTAGFVANLVYCTRGFGLSRGFVHYEDFPPALGQLALSSSLGATIVNSDQLRHILDYHELINRKTAAVLNGDFLCWLSRQDRRPFFAFLNYYDAHEPYLPPEPFDVKFGPKRPRGKFRHLTNEAERIDKWKMSPKEIQVELDAYEGAIAYVDHQLGLLFHELERRGVLENTLVIITSDHGEEFGEHGLFSHGHSLYLPSLHVPLLILFPSRVPAGKRIHEPVSLRDVPATVVDLIGLDRVSDFPGKSLARYWGDSLGTAKPAPEMLLSEVQKLWGRPIWYPTMKGAMQSLLFEGMHYIKNCGDGREELYDVDNDPWEARDLTRSEEGLRALEQFRRSLERILNGN